MKLMLLVIGDTFVGKTCIIKKYSSGFYVPNEMNTAGVDFVTRKQILDNTLAQLQIWDTPGQKSYRSIALSYVPRAHGIMLVYDITDRRSFKSIHKWVKDIELHADHIPMVLIGNKCDEADKREVSTAEASELANSLSIPFLEISAKTGSVTEAFIILAREAKDKIPVAQGFAVVELETVPYTAMSISFANERSTPPSLWCACCVFCRYWR